MWETITIPVWRIFLAGRVRYSRHDKQSPSQGPVRILLPSPPSPGSSLAFCTLPAHQGHFVLMEENVEGGTQWKQPGSVHTPEWT